MAKMKITTAEINKHRKALEPMFIGLSDSEMIIVNRMLDRVAFMLAQADELEKSIQKTGSIELFKNGAQEMIREHPSSKIHSTVSKNLLSYLVKLRDMVPEGAGEKDELNEFMERKKARAMKG